MLCFVLEEFDAKSSSLMKEEGFEDVYHLQGGILKYLETIDKENSLWNGECFVFDQRVCLTDELEVGSYKMCFAVGCQLPAKKCRMKIYRRHKLYLLL